MSRSTRSALIWALALPVWLVGGATSAAPLSLAEVPEPLKPWIPWVLQPVADAACPYEHTGSERRCAWPSRLSLDLGDQRGEFTQEWRVYARGFVPLPGDERRWPQEVEVDGQPAVVLSREGQPGLELEPGAYAIRGVFLWDSVPEKLAVPAETGLLSLKLRGESVAFPQRDAAGTLWLQKRVEAAGEQNLLDVVVHRKISDEIPLRVTTEISLHAAGKSREELLGKALLPDFVPMQVISDLPARLEPDGRLRVQVRPGAWTIRVEARHPGEVKQLALPTNEGPWAAEEVWVFAPSPELRRVELSGPTAVDPQQTQLPADWRAYPAFRVQPGEALALTATQRGEADRGPDQLALQRSWWLDFDGRGLTVRDQISGAAQATRRLEVQPPASLGAVEMGGQPQFITALADPARAGVELRDPQVRLAADLRVPAHGMQTTISAVDWDHDFASVSGVLHLPPGWRVLHASGVDQVDDTWLQRWTLLDLFLVLVIAIAIARLHGWAWGTLALVTLALVFPEWMAPRTVWIFVLVGDGLLRALPDGWLRGAVRAYRLVALVSLAAISAAFATQQIRQGLYPALETRVDDDGLTLSRAAMVTADMAPAAPPLEPMPVDEQVAPGGMAKGEPMKELEEEKAKAEDDRADGDESGWEIDLGSSVAQSRRAQQKQRLREYDASTVVQTGPGVPRWSWRAVPLRWNGPVERTQQVRLVLVPPHVNLALAGVRVLFLVTLLLAVFGVFRRRLPRAAGGLAIALALGTAALAPASASAAEIPSQATLDELRARLTEAPACLPSCATSPRMRLEAAPGSLRLVVEVHAAAHVALPLPGSAEHWLPSAVSVDGAPPVGGLRRTADGALWIALQPGRHELVLEGPLPARESVQLPLPVRPRRVVAGKTEGWTVAGLHEDGLADDVLQLTRVSGKDGGPSEALEVGTLPPFVRVERSLALGLTWEATTRVVRVTPRGSAVVLKVPLLPGESVTTADQRVEGGEVLVNMRPDQDAVEWTSVLPISPQIFLRATRDVPWSESWQVMVGPVWHVEATGIPAVRRGEAGLQEWRPWPGEQVVLDVSRPEGVPGQTLTIDRALLSLRPGLRAVDGSLELELRSSRGGHHVVGLPEAAQLQRALVDGRELPLGQEGRQVRLPIAPGRQTARLEWREPAALTQRYVAPQVDLGAPAVNAEVHVEFPQSRWILLLGGPRLGPAVLFWSYIVMLLVAAAALGRLQWSPLRGYQWFLLGIGLSTLDVPGAALVVGWFLLLGWRREKTDLRAGWFNLRQLMIVGWTFLAGSALLAAVHAGLLGQPDMQIEGNGSWGSTLRWYQDRVELVEGVGAMPQPWVLSVSLWWYRALMLAWALWLAWAMIRWVPWAFQSFSTGGLWRRVLPERPPPTPPPSASSPTRSQRLVLPAAVITGQGSTSSGQSAMSDAIFGGSMVGTATLPGEARRVPQPGPADTLEAVVAAVVRPEVRPEARAEARPEVRPEARAEVRPEVHAEIEEDAPRAPSGGFGSARMRQASGPQPVRPVAEEVAPPPASGRPRAQQPPPPPIFGIPGRKLTSGPIVEPGELIEDEDDEPSGA